MVGQTTAVVRVDLRALAKQINAAHTAFEDGMRQSLAYAVEAGEKLVLVKEQLSHGEWLPWLKKHFHGTDRTAQRYVSLAGRLPELDSNTTRVSDLSLRGALKLITKARHADGDADPPPEPDPFTLPADAKSTTDLNTLIAAGEKFGTIYADPPWQYGNQSTRAATDNHYPTMTLEALAALPVDQLAADDAHLHLWTTNAFLRQSFDILDAWGFEYRSVFVWAKPQMGIGNYWRVSHEFLMLGIRGDAKSFADRSLMSWAQFDRTEHSSKPEAVRKLIEKASPGPRLEMFGRRLSDGWTVFGNQISRTMFDAEAVA